jgi:hypothetical protein
MRLIGCFADVAVNKVPDQAKLLSRRLDVVARVGMDIGTLAIPKALPFNSAAIPLAW